MNPASSSALHRRFLPLLTLAGYSTLGPTTMAPPVFYALDDPAPRPAPAAPAAGPVLIVTPTRAAAGFDSKRIIYLREAHKPGYFAHSEWAEPPARMLGPLLVAALERSAAWSPCASSRPPWPRPATTRLAA